MMFKRRRMIKAITGGLVLCLLLSILGIYGQAQGVRDSVVRLHILANSDSTADQTLKLKVRDAVIAAAADWPMVAADAEEAAALARERLPQIQAVAQETVAAAGYDYPVTAKLADTYFTTRQYDTVTLPAGMYRAVQVTLGEGRGQNWWCVMYPPLCVGGAANGSDVFTPSQQDFLQGQERYRVRFWLVEGVETFFQMFR